MKKNIFMAIFWLSVCLAGANLSPLFAQPKFDFTPPKTIEEDEITKKESVPVNTNKAEEVTRPKVVYSGEGLKDPFEPSLIKKKEEGRREARVEPKALPDMKVQGLLWGGIFPQAIINNKVVKVGDSIGEVRITGINKEGITVFFANMEYKLSSPAVTGPQQKTDKNAAPMGKGGSNEKPF